MRVFLDANILFSAAKSDGAVRELLRRLDGGGHRLVADAFVLAEARRNLEAKGAASLSALDALQQRLESAGLVRAFDLNSPMLAWLPEKDRPVLAAAIALACDVLLTGDRRHFGSQFGRSVGGVRILEPAALARELLG